MAEPGLEPKPSNCRPELASCLVLGVTEWVTVPGARPLPSYKRGISGRHRQSFLSTDREKRRPCGERGGRETTAWGGGGGAGI